AEQRPALGGRGGPAGAHGADGDGLVPVVAALDRRLSGTAAHLGADLLGGGSLVVHGLGDLLETFLEGLGGAVEGALNDGLCGRCGDGDRTSTRLNSSHV